MNVHKIITVATTEFGTAVRSKSFVIGLLLLPIIMAGSILIQKYMAERVDTRPRAFAVVDRSGRLEDPLRRAVEARNQSLVGEKGELKGPRFEMTVVKPDPAGGDQQWLDLSEQIRQGKLYAYVEIPERVFAPSGGTVAYHSENPNDDTVRDWLGMVVNNEVRAARFREAGVDQALAVRLNQPVQTENLGLVARAAPASGGAPAIQAAPKIDPVRTFAVPAVILFIMFFVIMSSAPHLLNSVLEEKMSRVSEVLLGSVTPFELMMGKLLGNVGIASLLAFLYVGGAYGVAVYHGYGDVVTPGLLAVLAVFLVLAVLLYGSLYMAVGAACSELKDAQSLMMPVMLLSMLPMFVWSAVLKDPGSPLSVGMSLFPPSTPYLMAMRLAMHPTPPAWQVALGIALTLVTAVACVWAGGKIFRTGLLMHGKPPTYRDLARWVMSP